MNLPEGGLRERCSGLCNVIVPIDRHQVQRYYATVRLLGDVHTGLVA